MVRCNLISLILILSILQINCKHHPVSSKSKKSSPSRIQNGVEIHGGGKLGATASTSLGNQSYGEPCDRVKNECKAVWTYSKGRRCQIDLICYEGKCECPHPLRFWADTTTKTCRRKAGVTECDIQSDNACVPNAICVMEEIIDTEERILGFNTKCVCRSGCTQTRLGFCKCRSNFHVDSSNTSSFIFDDGDTGPVFHDDDTDWFG